MRTLLLSLLFVAVALPAAAQTTIKVQWDQSAATEGVTSYNLYIDSLPPISVPNTLNAACNCIQQTAAFSVGPHTLKITALAPDIVCTGCGPTQPVNIVEGPPINVSFTLNPGTQVKNIKVTK